MANVKITELTAATTLDGDDVFPVVDVSGDTTNKVSVTDLLRNVPDGTAAAPSIANTGDQDTGILFPAADTVAISTGGTQRFSVDGSGDVSISGSLTVSGTTTTIESTTLTVDDKNIELGTVATPTDTTADGGGITLKGATDKTINWVQSTGCWTFNQPMNFNDHVRIDSSGTVLVGATAQQYGSSKLEVADSDNAILYFYNTDVSASGTVTLAFGPSNSITGSQIKCIASEDFSTSANRTAGLAFETRQDGTLAERMRIDSSGNIGIGTTSPQTITHVFGADPILRIQDSSTSIADGFAAIQLAESGAGGSLNNYWQIALEGNSGTSTDHLTFKDGTDERMRIDSSGNVGIGTTSPDRVFEIQNSAPIIRLTESAGTYSEISASTSVLSLRADEGNGVSNTRIDFRVDGSEAMRIDSSGNLGIGTTSPAFPSGTGLEINDSSTPRLKFSNDTTGTGSTDGSFLYVSGSDFLIENKESANMRFYTSASERMRIDSSGNVGIGTSTIGSASLTLYGSGSRTMYQGSSTGTGDGNGFTVGNNGSVEAFLWNYENGFMQFATNNSERMRIDSSGRLLVGTSSARSDIVRPQLNIEGVGDTGLTIVRNEASASGPQLEFGKSRGTTTGSSTAVQDNDEIGMIRFRAADGTDMSEEVARITVAIDGTPGSNDVPGRMIFSTTADGASTPTERMRIKQNGHVRCQGFYDNTTASAANLHIESDGDVKRSTSSRKYKNNIETIEQSYSTALLDCRPVWYRSTCQGDNPEHGWWGFIAEEVAEIDPRLVHWKTVDISHDEDGSIVETPCDPEPEGVAYDRFVPHLLNLIKRQQSAIKTLETKVAALEA